LKDIDNIEDWYRDELNNYSVEPDKNGWNSLSGDLDTSTPLTDDTISEWYKKEVSKLEERPDYTVWEKIATQLDTTSVWEKVAVSLNRYDQLIWWRNVAIRGTAIFLLFYTSYLGYTNYTDNNKQIAEDKSSLKDIKTKEYTNQILTAQTENKTTVYEAAFINEIADKDALESNKNSISNNNNLSFSTKKTTRAIQNNNSTTKEKISVAVKSAKKTNKPNKRSRSKVNTPYASLEKIQQYYSSIYKNKLDELKSKTERTIFTEINRHQLTERDISHLMEDGEYLVKKDKNKIVFNSKRFSSYSMFGVYTRRFYAGFNLGVKKQGMITSLKKDSPLANYQQNSLLDFGNSFGGTVGFILSDNINIEANINLNSTSGYKRSFDAEGISFQENLNLDYTTINLLAKKMNNKSTFDNKVYSTNFIGGVYASYLRSAVSDINGTTRDLDEYNKTDYGIVLGIEQDRYISKTLVITPGIRYNQGLANIVNSDSSFDSSRNFSLEFNLGVKYIFLKKGK
jgi:hypothetical protein